MTCMDDHKKVALLAENFGRHMAAMRDFSAEQGVCRMCTTYHMMIGMAALAKSRGLNADDFMQLFAKAASSVFADEGVVVYVEDVKTVH